MFVDKVARKYVFHDKYKFTCIAGQLVYDGLDEFIVFNDGFKFDVVVGKFLLKQALYSLGGVFFSDLLSFLDNNERAFLQKFSVKLSLQGMSDLLSENLHFFVVCFRRMVGDLLAYKSSYILTNFFSYGPFFRFNTLRYYLYKKLLLVYFTADLEKLVFYFNKLDFYKCRFWRSFLFFLTRLYMYRRKVRDRVGIYRFVFKILRFLKLRKYKHSFRANRLLSSRFIFLTKVFDGIVD